MIDSQMNDMIKEKLALKHQIDSLEQNLSNQIKKKKSLLQTFTVFKNESKEKESKYMDKEIDLEKKIKELDNIVYKVGPSVQTVHIVISSQHVVIPVIDDEETFILEEFFGKHFVPQQELSAEQAFWLQTSHPNIDQSATSPVKIEAPRELPKVSLVNTSLKKLKHHFGKFDTVVKKQSTPDAITEGEWGFEHTKKVFNEEVIPFKNSLQTLVKDFENGLLNELNEVKTVFNQIEAAVDQCSIDNKLFEIEKKELKLENERLLEHIICQDVVNIVMHANDKSVNVLPVQNTFLDDNIALDVMKMENDRLVELLVSQDLVHTAVNSLAAINDYKSMEKSYLEKYNENLELKAQLLKRNNKIEQDVFIELSKRYSQLEKHCISLQLAMQQIANKTQLQAKDTTISNLKKHIQELKGKSVADCRESVNKPKVIVLIVRQPNAFTSERPRISRPRFASQVRESAAAKPHQVNAPNYSRNSHKESYGSNDMVHAYFLEDARKMTQDKTRIPSHKDMASTRAHCTPNACTPKPRNIYRSSPVSKFNPLRLETTPNLLNQRAILKKPSRQIAIGQRFSPKKSSAVHEKPNTPRSCLRWKPTCRIFKIAGLRWIPAGKMFTDYTTKVDSEPPNGSNDDITNPYECDQTLNVSAGPTNLSAGFKSDAHKQMMFEQNSSSLVLQSLMTSVHISSGLALQRQMASADNTSGPAPQRKESLKLTPGYISSGLVQNLVSSTPYVPPSKKDYEILFQPLFDEYFNPPPRAVSLDPVAVAAQELLI
ncbi:hypothetical protein Tco_0957763 [Tanacetum coccineum]